MVARRNDVETLAGVVGLLLEPDDPGEVADRFLREIVRLFPSDAGLFYVPGVERPEWRAFGLGGREADRLAALLCDELEDAGVRAVRGGTGPAARWPYTLAVVAGSPPDRRGMLALFSARSSAYDPNRDGRLLHLLTRHATAAVLRAQRHRRSREDAERFAVRVEEIERVRRALERHSRDVEWSLAARSRYLAATSHELRTPINAILGFADLLGQGILGELAPRQAEVVGKISSSAHHLLGLINDILDLSKIDAGRLQVQWESIDLPTLAREAAAAVEVEAARKGLDVRLRCHEPLPPIVSDAARVRQILLNLVSNGVKFTDSGAVTVDIFHIAEPGAGPVTTAPPCRPGAAGWIGVVVEDTGPGIPADQLETIFDEYSQLGGGPRGTGLGLSISRRLARLLGGDLVADSELGARTTFFLFLPCPVPDGEPSAAAAPPAAAHGPTDRSHR